jgi:SAM-dependent methyltransferase
VADADFAAARLVEVDCDACGGRDRVAVHALRRGHIVRCTACGFQFISPRAEPAWQQARLQYRGDRDVVDSTRLRIAFDPEALNGGPGRSLDVGCSTGALLVEARSRGWTVNGIEMGHASTTHARGLGLDIHRGSLYDAPPPAQPLDAVAFLEVIEHVESPREALRRLAGWIRPGGLLLLSTPNYDALYRRWFGAGWWVVNCEDEHIMLFDPRTLQAALKAAGFTPLQTQIRGLDLVGMWRQRRGGAAAKADGAEGAGHQESRERVKRWLGRLGVQGAARRVARHRSPDVDSRIAAVRPGRATRRHRPPRRRPDLRPSCRQPGPAP